MQERKPEHFRRRNLRAEGTLGNGDSHAFCPCMDIDGNPQGQLAIVRHLRSDLGRAGQGSGQRRDVEPAAAEVHAFRIQNGCHACQG